MADMQLDLGLFQEADITHGPCGDLPENEEQKILRDAKNHFIGSAHRTGLTKALVMNDERYGADLVIRFNPDTLDLVEFGPGVQFIVSDRVNLDAIPDDVKDLHQGEYYDDGYGGKKLGYGRDMMLAQFTIRQNQRTLYVINVHRDSQGLWSGLRALDKWIGRIFTTDDPICLVGGDMNNFNADMIARTYATELDGSIDWRGRRIWDKWNIEYPWPFADYERWKLCKPKNDTDTSTYRDKAPPHDEEQLDYLLARGIGEGEWTYECLNMIGDWNTSDHRPLFTKIPLPS